MYSLPKQIPSNLHKLRIQLNLMCQWRFSVRAPVPHERARSARKEFWEQQDGGTFKNNIPAVANPENIK